MIAQTAVIVDGQFYKKGDEIWDLGSFQCVSSEGNIRHYEGLSSDFAKLPHYVNTGSSALTLDTSQVYKFHKPTDTWHELG